MTVGGRSDRFPLGAALTREVLAADFHPTLARLRASEPVTWVPASNGWLVTRRDLASAVLRDSETFTVDDPRFSTGRVLGPSMLSLDGSEHERHRAPFASALCLPRVSEELVPSVARIARDLVEEMASDTRAELRTDLAGPLAVGVVSLTLDLMGVDPVEMRAWYDEIVAAVSAASDDPGGEVPAPPAVDRLGRHIRDSMAGGSALLTAASESMSEAEVVSNAAVMFFGGIETSEGATATVFAHLLSRPDQLERALSEPDLMTRAVDESLRLEPSVVQLDRFATRDVLLGDARIGVGDFVMVSVAAANRDPDVYPDPDRFDLTRSNARTHLSFAQGAHHCVGSHLARAEARAALGAAFARLPGLRLTGPVTVEGSVFRKPVAVPVAWIS